MSVQNSLDFWNKLKQKIRVLIKQETGNCVRYTLCEVISKPNGKTIGVKIPGGETVMDIPYSLEVSDAEIGSLVMVVWYGTMSTAKAYYYNYGFVGSKVHYPVTMEKFVFSLGTVENSTQTIWSFAQDQNMKDVVGKINETSAIIARPYFALNNQTNYENVLSQFYNYQFYATSIYPYSTIRIVRGTTEEFTLTQDFKIEVIVLTTGG